MLIKSSMQLSLTNMACGKLVDLAENVSLWNGSDVGEASQWNFTKTNLEDIALDANFAWLMFSLLIATIWFTYVTHYSSRVFGQILTKLFNHLVGDGYVKIGNEAFIA